MGRPAGVRVDGASLRQWRLATACRSQEEIAGELSTWLGQQGAALVPRWQEYGLGRARVAPRLISKMEEQGSASLPYVRAIQDFLLARYQFVLPGDDRLLARGPVIAVLDHEPVAEGEAARLKQLATSLHRDGRIEEAIPLYQAAIQACDPADALLRAKLTNNLGYALVQVGRYRAGGSRIKVALGFYRRTGEVPGQIAALNNSGVCHEHVGRFVEAASEYRQAADLARSGGLLDYEAQSVKNCAGISLELGAIDEAEDLVHRGEALCANGHVDRIPAFLAWRFRLSCGLRQSRPGRGPGHRGGSRSRCGSSRGSDNRRPFA